MKLELREPEHVHALANRCAPPVVEHGRQIVRYDGDDYLMVGIYFARSQGLLPHRNGDRELYYILKPISMGGLEPGPHG